MTLKEIIGKCGELKIDEQRSLTDEYVEVVFLAKELDQWNKLLADILGQAIKPKGANPSKEDQQLTEDYGGIHDNQTLFKKEFNGNIIIAMFWPWQDNVHVTLKAAVVKNG